MELQLERRFEQRVSSLVSFALAPPRFFSPRRQSLPSDFVSVAMDPLFSLLSVQSSAYANLRFTAIARGLKSQHLPMPVTQLFDATVPVLDFADRPPSLENLLNEPRSIGANDFLQGYIAAVHESQKTGVMAGFEVELMPPKVAVEHFRANVEQEIVDRLSGLLDKWRNLDEDSVPPGYSSDDPDSLLRYIDANSGAPPGVRTCVFEVTTKTPGLSVHHSGWSGIMWRYFGAPTSPVVRPLSIGTYIFAVQGPGYPTITPDKGTRVTCPGNTKVLLHF